MIQSSQRQRPHRNFAIFTILASISYLRGWLGLTQVRLNYSFKCLNNKFHLSIGSAGYEQ